MEIKLTINGAREIPIEVTPELASRLIDQNAENEFIITASLWRHEMIPSHSDQPATHHIKLKLVSIRPND